MKYRSRTDIVATILEAANGGTPKTKIMYRAYLSYAQLNDYLSVLTENGLVEFDECSLQYRTTEKGLRFMQAYSQMDEMMVSPQS